MLRLRPCNTYDEPFVFRLTYTYPYNRQVLIDVPSKDDHDEHFINHLSEYQIIILDDMRIGFVRKHNDMLLIILEQDRLEHLSDVAKMFEGNVLIRPDDKTLCDAYDAAGYNTIAVMKVRKLWSKPKT